MIELIDLCKNLGDFSLKNINLKVNNNEYFVLLGPTGTGKTVVLETIAGMYKPDKGKILFNGKNISKLEPEYRNIGFVYQDYILFPHLKVRDNIVFGLKLRKYPEKEIKKKLRELTDLLGIVHLLDRYPATLSGGEQQRVAIARTLVLSPNVLLLDEPLSALDPRTKQNFITELRKIHKEFNMTTIHITHDFNEALVLADKIGIMRNGQIVQTGTPEEVFYKPQSSFVAQFVGVENIYNGNLKEENGKKTLNIGGIKLKVISELMGNVKAIIRPEEIILSKNIINSSARNIIKCYIQEIIPQGTLVKVKMYAGISITAVITKYALKEMNIKIGDTIFSVFKSTSVHVFK